MGCRELHRLAFRAERRYSMGCRGELAVRSNVESEGAGSSSGTKAGCVEEV